MDTQIPVGKLKTHCYQILEQAQKDNSKLIITKRGNPIAEIIPTQTKKTKKSLIGIMAGKAKINDDIMKPLDIHWAAENE